MKSPLQSACFKQYAVAITVNLCIVTTGMSLVWPSPMLVKLRNSTETNLDRPITEEEGSWIVSIGFLSSSFANSLLGFLIDRIGRKYCIILTCIPKILVSILFIFADRVWMLILGRSIIGMADFFLFSIIPVYVSEIADNHRRGALCTLLQIFSSLGIVVTLSVGPFVSYKVFSIIFGVMNVVTWVPLFLIPDSPYYLYSKGKTEQAISALTFFRGSDNLTKKELEVYETSSNQDRVNKIKLFKKRTFLKSLGLSLIFSFVSQFTGFNAVSFYLQTILESTRTNVMPEIASVIIGLIQLLASFCSSSVSDRFKRKHILITSLVGMLIGLLGLGAFFKIRENTQITGALNYLPLVSLILVIFCYSAGIGSVFWVLIPELFEDTARALGVTINLMVMTLSIFIITKYFSLLTVILGPYITYWSFSAVCLLYSLFVYYCIPETQGKTFKEIQNSMGAKRKIKDDLE